jgi:hypothetical protein
MGPPTTREVLSHLGAVHYAAEKDQLVAVAERDGSDERVLAVLRALPPVTYRSRAELVALLDAGEARRRRVRVRAGHAGNRPRQAGR